MRVTFDSNTWQRVVCPDKFKNDPRHPLFLSIQGALKARAIEGYISETVATLEAIPKVFRPRYLETRQPPVTLVEEKNVNQQIKLTFEIAGKPEDHPGLTPILVDRIGAAVSLGFKIIPVPRLGMPRPKELDREEIRIPLTDEQRSNIWPLLERINEVSSAIESRGCGRMILQKVAARIRKRSGIPEAAWFTGLDQPTDLVEEREIIAGYAEWADADSIAVHVGYNIDVFCTEDFGRGAKLSVLNAENRNWLQETFGLTFMTISELAESMSSGH